MHDYHNYLLNVCIYVETPAAVYLSFGVELPVNHGGFNHTLEASQMGGGANGCGSNYFTARK